MRCFIDVSFYDSSICFVCVCDTILPDSLARLIIFGVIFCQDVILAMRLHLHVTDTLAGTAEVIALVGHLLVKGDDILHHGLEVAFHDEFAERERTGTTPIKFCPERVFVLHASMVLSKTAAKL